MLSARFLSLPAALLMAPGLASAQDLAAPDAMGAQAGADPWADPPPAGQPGAEQAPPIPPYVEGSAYAYGQGGYCYVGPHPTDPRYTSGQPWDDTQGMHVLPYAPIDLRLFSFQNGCYYFIGDPSDFGYQGNVYSYYGAHPVAEGYGGGWCFMIGGHSHYWQPWSPYFTVVGPWYYWSGAYDPFFWAYWPYYAFYYRSYYPHYYGGGHYWSGRHYASAPPIHHVPPTPGWHGTPPASGHAGAPGQGAWRGVPPAPATSAGVRSNAVVAGPRVMAPGAAGPRVQGPVYPGQAGVRWGTPPTPARGYAPAPGGGWGGAPTRWSGPPAGAAPRAPSPPASYGGYGGRPGPSYGGGGGYHPAPSYGGGGGYHPAPSYGGGGGYHPAPSSGGGFHPAPSGGSAAPRSAPSGGGSHFGGGGGHFGGGGGGRHR